MKFVARVNKIKEKKLMLAHSYNLERSAIITFFFNASSGHRRKGETTRRLRQPVWTGFSVIRKGKS